MTAPAAAGEPGRRPLVLLTGPLHAPARQRIEAVAEVRLVPDTQPDTLRRLVRDADVLVVRSNLPADLLDHAPRLRAIVRPGVGVDMIPVAAATARGIPVANVPGSNRQAVAEHVITALGVLLRRQHRMDALLRSEGWAASRALADGAGELARQTIGIVGVGSIGLRVAEIAHHGYRMQVLGHQRRLEGLPAFVEGCALDELLARSRFVVLTCPLTEATRGLLDARRIGLLRRDALLVNVSRGAIVDEAALVDALRGQRIAGAALDVFVQQPLPEGHALLALPNVLLTPHAAGLTEESMAAMSDGAADEVVRVLRGEGVRNGVNLSVDGAHGRA
ncbi:D-isomer specific 2-hydroxyacid dehydrogenase family protein [Aquincola sp. J276]|uniref:NAD(P)-dependent oxidoreductase n=1 Tax=Aquincola sp. J276 TaxID=2898432 RepID=UPI002151D28E|nr:NAD(P)-dependent oxidoreductase [Aquincola sp. J276]MCR5869036.1 hydroxyacid dehydrogenase [Aquincola sp. J276]